MNTELIGLRKLVSEPFEIFGFSVADSSLGKHSPDAYLQMALQLAYHKSHNVPVATYETASTRLFKHGRTDVIRTFSEDSWKFVKAIRDGKTEVSYSSHRMKLDTDEPLSKSQRNYINF